MADGFAHPPDLAVASLADDYLQRSGVLCLVVAGQFHPRRGGDAVIEGYAHPQPVELFLARPAGDGGYICLVDPVTGMGQGVGKLAVVGHEEQSLGVVIQPPHRVEADGDGGDKIGHRFSAARVAESGNNAAGFIQQHVYFFFASQRPAIDGDDVPPRLHFGAEFGDNPPVHGDATG